MRLNLLRSGAEVVGRAIISLVTSGFLTQTTLLEFTKRYEIHAFREKKLIWPPLFDPF